jgi:hypothetical protein
VAQERESQTTGHPFLSEGEFIEEEVEMDSGTKVGELSWSHRQRVSPGLEIETTYSGDIIQEHKITQ